LYNSTESSTYVADLSPVQMHYAGLYSFGNVSVDTIRIAGIDIEKQAFEEVTLFKAAPFYWDHVLDSVLGLSRLPMNNSRSTLRASSPFHNIISRQILDRNLFTITFPQTIKAKGELVFGGIDEELFIDELVKLPISKEIPVDPVDSGIDEMLRTGWHVSVHSISIGSNGTHDTIRGDLSNYTAHFASSLAYIILPPSIVDPIYQRINPNPGDWDIWDSWVPCERRSTLPNITISLGPKKSEFVLTPWDYTLEHEAPGGSIVCIIPFASLPDDTPENTIVLGNGFLKGFFSVFDYDNEEISCKVL
jgi:saccharopepsin